MKSFSVYLTYSTFNRIYRLSSISFKNIQANDSSSAISIAMERAKNKVKNNVTPFEVSMFWLNIA